MTDPVILQEETYQLATYRKFPLVIERGEDVWVETSDGRRYLDLYGGHAVTVTGHCHPRLVRALAEQAGKLLFYSNVVYNPTRAGAARALIEVAPEQLSKVFFVNSGAEANENAIKLARKVTERTEVVSFEGGFHGRTIGALSATGMKNYRDGCRPLVPDHLFVPFGDLAALGAVMGENTAAVILEPIQSMAGVRIAAPGFYQGLRRLCDQWGALLIYDEAQTGIGRTGDYFFAPLYEVTPDILSLAKGLASGIPMGAVLVGEKVAEKVGFGDLGSTFGGGPLACAALQATLGIIQQEGLLDNVRSQSQYLRTRLLQVPFVENVLGLGFLLGIQVAGGARPLQQHLLGKGILTGLSSDPQILRLMPALTLKKKEIDYFLEALTEWT